MCGALCPVKPRKRTFPCSFAFTSASAAPLGRMKSSGIVIECHAVNLPEIEMIGLQPAQRLLEHFRGKCGIAAVCTDLRHQENLIAQAFEPLAHPVLGFAAVILPAVVEESDSAVDCLIANLDGGGLILCIAKMMPAQPKRGNLDIRSLGRNFAWELNSS